MSGVIQSGLQNNPQQFINQNPQMQINPQMQTNPQIVNQQTNPQINPQIANQQMYNTNQLPYTQQYPVQPNLTQQFIPMQTQQTQPIQIQPTLQQQMQTQQQNQQYQAQNTKQNNTFANQMQPINYSQQNQSNQTTNSTSQSTSGGIIGGFDKTSKTNYIIIAVVIIVFLIVCWYAYNNFSTSFGSGDEPIAGYNLQDTLQRLENKQSKILQGLSRT